MNAAAPIRLDPPPRGGEAASAPYNFVRLPRGILSAADATNQSDVELFDVHNRFVSGRLHGHIDLEITALTPLYIRGRRRPNDGRWTGRDTTVVEPALDRSGRPIIPGSSLRGMTRSLVELLTFSKVPQPHDDKPFFRTVDNKRVGVAYRNRMLKEGRPEGGFLRHTADGWSIDVREVVRVPHQMIPDLGYQLSTKYHPNPALQGKPCFVRLDGGKVGAFRLKDADAKGADWSPGTLVLTGAAPKKLAEFVFLDGDTGATVRVPQAVMDRVNDDDQITRWQQLAFPSKARESNGQDREKAVDGAIVADSPVFFIRANDGSGVEFLGRARMFRLPYDRSLSDLIPAQLSNEGIDLAEAIFGTVRHGSTRPAIKGRVYFDNAHAVGDAPPDRWTYPWITPHVLSGPKATTYVHYLTQPSTTVPEQLTTYIAGDSTVPRGYKVYFHRSDPTDVDALALVGDNTSMHPEDKQHTKIAPVREGTRFAGRVRFENLTPVELGAVLAAIELQPGCAHRIGMAKPLGLGSIKLDAGVTIIDPATRYRSWRDTGARSRPETEALIAGARQAFEREAIAHAVETGEPTIEGGIGITSIARFAELFTMLDWDNRPAPASTAQLTLEQFKHRRVLPDPFTVTGQQVVIVDKVGEPPSAARRELDIDADRRNRRPQTHRNGGSQRSRPRWETPPEPVKKVALVGRLGPDRTKKGGMVFNLNGGIKATLHPLSLVPTTSDLEGELAFEHAADGSPYIQVRWIPPTAT